MRTIPKIYHLTWNIGSPMAMMQVFAVMSFHKYNPEWRIILHLMKQTPQELDKTVYVPPYTGTDYFYMVKELDYVEIKNVDLVELGIDLDKSAILASDILRRRVLYEYGGVYSDSDVLWLKPMSAFANIDCIGDPNDFEEVVCFHKYTKSWHNVSVLISEPGSMFNLSIIEAGKKVRPPYPHQAFGTDLVNSLYPTWESIVGKFPRMLAVKYETFYPYGILNVDQLFKATNLSLIDNKNVMCIHWWFGHHLTKEYLNAEDYHRECSMTSILKMEGYL